ncbi:MAG: DsbA family protein [Parvularculaceae bacterium]
MKQRILIIAALMGSAFFGAIGANVLLAQQSKREAPGDLDREAIAEIVRETLREDPSIIVEALNLYSENHVKDTVVRYLPEFLSEKSGYVTGKNPAAAKVAVIELFDYHCGFCKRSAEFVRDLTKSDAAVKVAFREFPILREESDTASRYALAAREQGKDSELHFAMLKETGVVTKERIHEIAKKLGLDVKKLEADSQNPEFSSYIATDRQAAQELGIDGTPTFIVASLDGSFVEIIPGYRPDDVKAAIAEAKKQR